MDLELVEDARRERELRGAGAVDEDVAVARCLLGLAHRRPDVGHVPDEPPLPDVDPGLPAGDDEARHAIVVVAAPAARRLERLGAGDDRPGGHELVDGLAARGGVEAARLPGEVG